MRLFQKFARSMTLLACSGMLLPGTVLGDRTAVPMASPRVLDVSLHDGGLLVGQVVNSAGKILQNVDVTIASNGKALAATKTDSLGRFAMKGLESGIYQIATNSSQLTCRAWTKDSAPPSSVIGAMLVEGTTVRGQCGCKSQGSHGGYVGGSVAPSFNQGASNIVGYQQSSVHGTTSFNQGGYNDAAVHVHSGPNSTASFNQGGYGQTYDAGASYGGTTTFNDGSAVASVGESYAGGGYSGGTVYGGYGAAGGAAGATGGGLFSSGGILGGSGLLSSPWLLGAGVAAAVAVPVALDDDDAS